MRGYQQSSTTQTASTAQSSSTTYGGASSRGNEFAQGQLASESEDPSVAGDGLCTPDQVSPAPVAVTGQPDFYDERYWDFVSRYASSDCGVRPPDYYLNYGGKYCRRFTTVLRPRLSTDGQAWLDRAALNLQNAIEDERMVDPVAFDRLERANDRFRQFAYGTHADSYLDAGLGDLDPIDLAMIGLAPDVGDLLTVPGISQAVETALRILPRWGDNLDVLTPEQMEVVDAWMRSGRGTIEDVTAFGYELAAEGLEPAVEWVDATFGEGATERVLDEARERAQDGVDAISEPVRTLMDEAEVQWPWEDG